MRCPQAQRHVDYINPKKIYEALLAEQADLVLVSYPVAYQRTCLHRLAGRGDVWQRPCAPLARKSVLLPAA